MGYVRSVCIYGDPYEGRILTREVGEGETRVGRMKRRRDDRLQLLALEPLPRRGHAVDETVDEVHPSKTAQVFLREGEG